ncbi:hypothetical protein [Streptomyces sp. NEAU-YJ-81]|uniref:hypothetical protein n=1 Tax=Streptomyces sp. NEAU-YJ-81 TaxID=2820288 RepID=UPI001ABC860D|nr:hypothetical protein [Streptomyces sp. NEAU-YJ-81]MBO3681922.1 hypothetical protein [Streptomyces sp. NEAU-YJ-81]
MPGLPGEGDGAPLRALIAQLLAVPGVLGVADRPDIPAALGDLGIRPDVAYAARSPLLHAHRAARDVAYHFFANGSATEAVDHEVAIASPWAKATPYALDAWTGEVGPVAVHRCDGGRVTLRMTLVPEATALVALAHGVGPVHAISTHAEAACFTDGVLEVVDIRPGARETMLSDGRKVLARIGELPAPLVLGWWSLRVADWRPGSSPDRHVTVDHRLDLGALAAWPDIPGLEDVSGVGRYRTTVRLGRGWTGTTGARLELGEVFDTCRVTVHGTALPGHRPRHRAGPRGPGDGRGGPPEPAAARREHHRSRGGHHAAEPVAHRPPRGVRRRQAAAVRPDRAGPTGALRTGRGVRRLSDRGPGRLKRAPERHGEAGSRCHGRYWRGFCRRCRRTGPHSAWCS